MNLRKIAAFFVSAVVLIAITATYSPVSAQGWHHGWRHHGHRGWHQGWHEESPAWVPGPGYHQYSWAWWNNHPYSWRQAHPYSHRSGLNIWLHL